VFSEQGDLPKAEAHFREAIRVRPDYTAAHHDLGVVLDEQGKTGEAVQRFEQGLRTRPDDLPLHCALAAIARRRGDVRTEVQHLRRIVELDPGNLPAANSLAWILATSDDDSLRNGKQALQLARRCAKATGHEQAGALDTLAAAFAETGDFAEAVRWQTQAVELAQQPEKAELRSRLELYEVGKPFRQQSAAGRPPPDGPGRRRASPAR
jgi:Flp pilus assembly protein TadD